MIVVVEGPSAVGKTTWCAAHGSGDVVAESGPIRPPDGLDDDGVARFWSAVDRRRWAEALRVEAEGGRAVCDTDPLKLHYAYCLARVGVASWERFDSGVHVTSQAITSRWLGIADIVLVEIPDDETLARRRRSDPTRSRRNFDLHRRLGPALRDWYDTLARLDPGRVRWDHPPEMPPTVARDRYDPDLFRDWMARLPRHTRH